MPRRLWRCAVVVVLVLLSGALSHAAKKKPMAPEPGEYDAYQGDGTSTITGQGFSRRTDRGEIRYMVGERVTIEPYTPSAQRFYQKEGAVRRPPFPEAKATRRATVSDGEGRFRFENLPEGYWIVVSQLYWTEPSPSPEYGRDRNMGGPMVGIVQVGEGETVEVILRQYDTDRGVSPPPSLRDR